MPHKWVLPTLYPKQRAVFYCPERISICEASTKSGKAQPLDAVVYTPNGPKRMGEIHIGDAVCTPTGASRVVAIHPQGEKPIYRVSFADGASAECTSDHLWEIYDDRRDYRRGFRARELAGALTRKRRKDRIGSPRVVSLESFMALSPKRQRRMWIRVSAPVEYSARPIPIDPYLLGVLLSEGGLTSDCVRFTTGDTEVANKCAALLPPHHALLSDGKFGYTISAGKKASALAVRRETMAAMVRSLGLMGLGSHEKFIPEDYRYNSIDIRWRLIRGIMDGDGFVDAVGQPHLEQTSPTLARHFTELAESLGASVITTIKEKSQYRKPGGRAVPCRAVYRQVVRCEDAAKFFSLKRKVEKCRKKSKTMGRRFRSIELIGNKPVQCITIDDPAGLYLTDRHIVTHNSVGGLVWLLDRALTTKGSHLWVSPVYSQSKVMYDRMERMLRGANPKCDLWSLSATELRINIVDGGRMLFKGSDNYDSIYGSDYNSAVIDEASRVREESYHAVRSTLTATGGPLRIIGNVKGKKNWAYRLARRAEAGERGMAYHRITAADAVEASVIAPGEIDDARRDLPANVFRELYEAEASDDGGNPFGYDHIEACVAPASSAPTVIYGVDLAKSVDWTVCIGLDAAGRWTSIDRWQGPWRETLDRLAATIGTTKAIVDSTGVGDPIVEGLQRVCPRVDGFKFSSQSKQRIMEGLAMALQTHRVSVPDGPCRLELEAFEYRYTRTGVTYTSPDGSHDDCVCALALAVSGILNPSEPEVRVVLAGGFDSDEGDKW